MQRIYGQYLHWLHEHGDLSASEGPAERVTHIRYTRFLVERRGSVSPNTVFNQVRMLAMMMNVLAPCAEWGWLYRHPLAPRRHEAAEARRTVPVVKAGYLLARLESAIDQVLREPNSKVSALRLRDLLIVAVTATTALRRRNIIALSIGESIIRHQHGYEIRFAASAVKNSRAISMALMPELISSLDRYIEFYRPLLLAGQEDSSRALWVSNLARRLASNPMNAAFRQVTSELLGRQLNPHSLRHSAATAILIQNPLATGMASATLAHGSEATFDKYYDLSGDAAARALWCKLSGQYRAHAKGDASSRPPRGRRARSGTTGFQRCCEPPFTAATRRTCRIRAWRRIRPGCAEASPKRRDGRWWISTRITASVAPASSEPRSNG